MPRIAKDHAEDHRELHALVEGWAGGPISTAPSSKKVARALLDSTADMARTGLLVHLSGFHGWRVADVGNVGVTPLAAWHDVAHGQRDVLRIEAWFEPIVREALADERKRIQEAGRAEQNS